jgi:ubiquitin carboxyl-terminal hydrolase 20/33
VTPARGLVGLSNLGNTCYMNAALQCLSNTPALTQHLLDCPDLVPRDLKPNLSLAYRNLLLDLWCSTVSGYVEPSGVLHAIKSVFPAFRGFQQHDSQEFLRCMMDQLHKVPYHIHIIVVKYLHPRNGTRFFFLQTFILL